MSGVVAVTALLLAGAGTACAQATWDAVMCRTVTDRGQPMSPGAWFPLGTSALTVWFRGDDAAPQKAAQVRWLLNGAALATREVALEANRPAFSRYGAGEDEPLPAGVYEAAIVVGGREVARAQARVGGKPPEGPDVTAIQPSEAPAGEGERTSGLTRRGRTDGVESPPPPATAVAPPAELAPAVPAVVESLVPGAVTPPTPTRAPAAEGLPEPPRAVTGVTLGDGPPSPGDLTGLGAPSVHMDPIILGRPTAGELALPAPGAGGAGTVGPGIVTPPAPTPAGAMPVMTAPGGEPAGVSVPGPETAPPPATHGDTAVAAEGAPEPPLSVPLGPRAAADPASRPVLSRVPSATPPAEPPGSTVLSRPRERTDDGSAATAIPRTRPGVSPMATPVTPRVERLPTAAPSVAQPSPPTRERMATASPPAEEDAEPAVVVPLRPERRPPGEVPGGAIEQAEEGIAGPPPVALPEGVPLTPPDEDPRPAGEPGDAPTVPGAVAATTPDAPPREPVPGAPETGAPAETPPAPEASTPPERTSLRLTGPLTADALAEDMPPIGQTGDAIGLHHVTLERVPEPVGLQPLWVMRVPDGRLWPPGLPTQFGLHAGDAPDPSPENLLLYSDHIDGVMPLYEVPREEALLLAARENDAALLSMGREMFEARRETWQRRAQGWRWMWYVRQIDLAPGETVVAGLVDVRHSPRAPEGFASTAQDEVILLDEAGRRVATATVTAEMAAQVAPDLGAAAPVAWTAPSAGRYQVWAALGMDKSRARCLVWTSASTATE